MSCVDNTNPPISSDEALAFCEMVEEIGMPDDTVIPVWPTDTEMCLTHPLTVGMVKTFKAALSRPAAPLPEVGEESLAQELREEADRLSFKLRCNAMRGKTFTMEEAQQLCSDRDRELSALNPQPALKQEVEGVISFTTFVHDGRLFGRCDNHGHVFEISIPKEYSLAAQATAEAWRDISTAPKDGTEFFAWVCYHDDKIGQLETRCRYNEDGAFQIWMCVDYDQEDFDTLSHARPTHWQPLPTPPADTQGRVKSNG